MFSTGSYQVERHGPGYYLKGRYVKGPKETVEIQGSLQPLTARELKLVSEGARLKQCYKFYTDAPLVTVSSKELAMADVVKINGDTFKVMSVEAWPGTDIPYYKSILYREPEQ